MVYWDIFLESFAGYARYLANEVLHPHWRNYFFWLIAISLAVYLLELLAPWRKRQSAIRRDFWLDGFYMFFNFFIFPLLGFIALASVTAVLFHDLLAMLGLVDVIVFSVETWPNWTQLLVLFLVRDFIHFNVHRLLHRVPFLWRFHQVHHSVTEMGFAAHLRFHWMESVVYRTLEFLPLAMIGFSLQDFIIVHLFALTIGHLNHANAYIPMGPLKYIFNSAGMHLWHHMDKNPEDKPYGVNFGISLSLWDYLFGTAHYPRVDSDVVLGFENVENFPRSFWRQVIWPLR